MSHRSASILRLAKASLCLVLFVLSTACTTLNESRPLQGAKPPYGGRMAESIWDRVDGAEETGILRRSRTFAWFLPLNLYSWDFAVARDRQTAHSRRLVWNDLASPALLTTLPLRFVYSEYVYDRSSDRPVAKHGLVWSLLWARSFGDPGSTGGLQSSIRGVPLISSWGRIQMEEAVDVRFWHALWTLGPWVLKMDLDAGEERVTGDLAAPLLLGGALGGILWTDYHLRARPSNSYVIGHGPGFGTLGYWAQKSMLSEVREIPAADLETPPEQEVVVVGWESLHNLVLGIVWQSYTRRDAEHQIEKSRHGPVWTMFGWHKTAEKQGPRLFWLPILF